MLLARAAAPAVAILVAACGGGSGPAPACTVPDGGDVPGGGDGTIELALIYSDLDGAMHDLVDGSEVPLYAAPQGGHILLIGARVRGVTGCTINVIASLRDPCNDRVLGLEQRPIVVDDRGDGWAVPVASDPLSSYANVAVCPVEASTHDVDGFTYLAEVRIEDDAGTVLGEASATITPTCGSADTYCACDCDLVAGADCQVDPGPDANPGCGA